MMSEEELNELAADIKANGLRVPIVIDGDSIVDGRNRFAACKIAEVKPTFEPLGDRDPIALVVSGNVMRRNLTKGQKAIAIAFLFPGGQGKKDAKGKTSADSAEVSYRRIREARSILRHSPKLAEAVRDGLTRFDEALGVVAEESDRQRTQADRLKDEARQLAELRKTAPDLAEQVDEEKLSLAEALAAFAERKRQRREEEQVTTGNLQRAMSLLDQHDLTPDKWAQTFSDFLNPEWWAKGTGIECSAKSIRSISDGLSALAKLVKKGEIKKCS